MNDRKFAIIAVCMVVFGGLPLGVASVGAGSATFDTGDSVSAWGGKTTAYTASLFDRSGEFVGDDRVVTHGEGLPGWYVSYDLDDNDSYANLDTWANASDDRRVLEHDVDDGRVLLAAPPEHIRRTGFFSVDGLVAKSWVESIEIEQRVELVDPVELESSDTISTKYEPTRRAKSLAWIGGGTFATDDDGAKGVAYDGDVEKTDMQDVKQAIGADDLPAGVNGSSTTTAVLDTGANVGTGSDDGVVFGNGSTSSSIRITHGKNFFTGATINSSSGNYSAIADGNLHGSYTAARIAGAGGGSTALRSAAYDGELAIGKVLDDDGGGSVQNIVDGLEWACSDTVDADVVSMSLGSPQYSKVLEDEIHECLTEDDVSAVVVAAGNSRWTTGRTNVGSPADADGVITVVATTTNQSENAEIAYFGNVGPDDGIKDGSSTYTRGELPDVGAPGMENTVLLVDSSGTARNVTLSGTSMSTPDVAMAAALLVDDDPALRGDHDAVRERLLETADPAPKIGYTEIGHGLLNVSRAIDDDRPQDDQKAVRIEQAKARDQANEALAGRIATFLKSNGVPV